MKFKACFLDSSTNPNKRILRIEFEKTDVDVEEWLSCEIEKLIGVKPTKHTYTG